MPFWAGIFYVLVPRARRTIEHNLERVLGPASPVEEKARSFRLFVNYAQSITNMYCLHLGQPVPVDAVTVGQEHILDAAEGEARRHRRHRPSRLLADRADLDAAQVVSAADDGDGRGAERRAPPSGSGSSARSSRSSTRPSRRSPRSSWPTCCAAASSSACRWIASLGGAARARAVLRQPAPFPLGPATLARATGTPLLPTFIIADADRTNCTVHVEAPIEVAHTRDRDADVREATERVVAVYERYVRTYPEQWFNFFDFWNPPAARRPPHEPTSQLP